MASNGKRSGLTTGSHRLLHDIFTRTVGFCGVCLTGIYLFYFGQALYERRSQLYSGARPQVGGSCTLPGASSTKCLRISVAHHCDSGAYWDSHAASSDLGASKGERNGPLRNATTASPRAFSTFLRFWVIGLFAISYLGITLFVFGKTETIGEITSTPVLSLKLVDAARILVLAALSSFGFLK